LKRQTLAIPIIAAMLAASFGFPAAAAELRETTILYQSNGEWRTVHNTSYAAPEVSVDGWHEEAGNTFYLVGGNAVTEAFEIEGKLYFFDDMGRLLEEGSEEYCRITELLSEMHEAKANGDVVWKRSFDPALTEYQQYKILDAYCEQYLYGSTDVGDAGFKFLTPDTLMLDPESPRYATEKVSEEFFGQISVKEDWSNARKARTIHDAINRIFSYDYSLRNNSGSLLEAHKNNNRIVCGGYAEIFSAACRKYGLEAEVLTGEADDGMGNAGMHAWNRVKINGEWKYVDCTWDDATGSLTWFLKSKEFFDATHSA